MTTMHGESIIIIYTYTCSVINLANYRKYACSLRLTIKMILYTAEHFVICPLGW